MKKLIVIFIVILGITGAGVAGWYFFAQSKAGGDGEIAYVTSVGTLTSVTGGMQNRFSGVVEAQETWNVELIQERTVKELLVEVGQQVEVGTALFTYDVDSQQVELSQADLDLERIDVSISNLTEQIAQLEKEKTKAAQADKFSYTAQIQTAEMEIKQAEYERKSKEADIKRINQTIENSTVHCQLAGVIKSINTSGAINSTTGKVEPYISVLASGDLRIKGSVNEQNLSGIVVGAPVLIYSRVDDTVWTGVINKLDTENPNASNTNGYYGNSGETSTTYPFYITLDSALDLKMGQHVYIEMNAGQEEKKEGLWLSEFYLVIEEDAAYVWAQDNKEKLEKRKITLGAYDESLQEYEIVSGLTIEDKIAMPADYLKEGMNVEVGEISGSGDNYDGMNPDEINLKGTNLEDQIIEKGEGQVLPEEGEAIDRAISGPQEQDEVVTEGAQ